MNRAINWFRLFFCTFSGEDDYIIRECKPRIQISFALIGLFVLIVFAGCWVSASSFMSELFEGSGKWLSIPIGIIWALLVANMYLLLLYTVSPTLLPVARKNTGKGKKRNKLVERRCRESDKICLLDRKKISGILCSITIEKKMQKRLKIL